MESWPEPRRIFLHTYNSLVHLAETVEHGLVGVPENGAGSASKANRLQIDDWVLLRVTDPLYRPDHLVIASPLRVIGAPFRQSREPRDAPRWPDLLWKEEREAGVSRYGFRIPVTHVGTPFRQLQIAFEDLGNSGIKGRNRKLLEVPNQWGIKFVSNVLDARFEIVRVLDLLSRFSKDAAGTENG